MTRLAGALLERPPGKKYIENLRFAELRLPVPVPRTNTLSKWRVDSAEGEEPFLLSLEAPGGTFHGEKGELRLDETMESRIEWVREAMTTLGAFALIVRTSAEVTPSRRDRDRLRAAIERVSSPDWTVVWEARGMWEPEERAKLAASMGAVASVDPLVEDVPPPHPDAPFQYARVRTVGSRSRISEGLLYEIEQSLADSPRAFVAIESPRSYDRAVALQSLLTP